MSNKKENQSIVDSIWSLFSSITLAVVVFSIISITSIVGTIVEQQAEPERNIKLLSKFFGDAAPTVFRVLDTLGFTNMFHSWWFITLLFIFAANLVICSLDRLPKIWKFVKEPVKPLPPELLNTVPIKREAVLKGKIDNTKAVVESAMKGIGFKANIHQEEGGLQLYSEKGRHSRLGVYVTHLSILIILTGAVVGIFWGFNASLNLLEGTTSPVAYMRNGKEIPLGFEIGCNDFEVSFYENSDTPKSYKSWLTISENGRPVKIGGKEVTEIDVNRPLRYKGITLYQSSYGFSPTKDSLFKLSVTSNDGKKQDIQLKFGESFNIPGTNIIGKVADFSPALGIDEAGRLFTYAEMMNNPAVLVEFTENGKQKYNQWFLKRYPQTWRVPDGVVEFKDLWGAQYTGLQVRKDPGVWIVYLGCIVMSIGLYAAFFMSHARIWVSLKDEKGSIKVTIAASTNKNKIAFEQKIDKLIKGLKTES
ncbi:MAG: cytochrome c biogenesis protein ResB [Nitrospirae bacterium]|nr:cytochrome c biogenesis protein ResB [Nitrospirota bacterium]MCL5062205.1 cytochrome c biogenesis protein ResB [Nitrospirota bacterium]MDA8214362.1 cytochrome c biogenesis protein ResB [Nitrospiraceae bacterium]MDA8339203.1 cytochrome c biogenesis protein ResB [Nitrospiraceae bacterium]